MNTTKLIAVCAIVTALAQASITPAAPIAVVPFLVCGEALAQSALPPPSAPPLDRASTDDRREVEILISRARQAMKEGKLDAAESMISRAEAMKVEFSLFHLGDTPKKARRDLQIAQKQNKRPATPKLPSEKTKPAEAEVAAPSSRREKADGPKRALLTQPLGDATGPPSQESLAAIPSLGRPDKGMQRATGTPLAMPSEDEVDAVSHITGAKEPAATQAVYDEAISEPGTGAPGRPAGKRQESDALLLTARRALAVGDVRRAIECVQNAKRINTQYEFNEDTPAKVDAMVRRYRDVMDARAGREASEGWRHQYSELLMDQAQQLLRWREYDEAERLTQDAARMKVSYGPFEARPEALLARISTDRKKNGGATANVRRLTDDRTVAAATKRPTAEGGDKERANLLTRQARGALVVGSLDQAEQLAHQAEALGVPERAFAPEDDSPQGVLADIERARTRGGAKTAAVGPYPSTQASYDPASDRTKNRLAGYEDIQPNELPELEGAGAPKKVDRLPPVAPRGKTPRPTGSTGEAMSLVRDGEQALQNQDIPTAKDCFARAYALRNQLDPNTVQHLQDRLQMLAVKQNRAPAAPTGRPAEDSLLDSTAAKAQLLAKQLSAEVMRQQQAADKIHEKEPIQAREILVQVRQKVEESDVDAQHKALLFARLDRSLSDLEKYMEANKAQISLDSRNKETTSKIERKRHRKIEVQDKLARLVDEYNTLIDERRYDEAEVLAKRAQEMDPKNPVVVQLVKTSMFIRRTQMNADTADLKERNFWETLNDVERSAIPTPDGNPYRFPDDIKKWEQLTQSPHRKPSDNRAHRTERELEIERKLKTPVSCKFRNRPLTEVLEHLAKLAAINLYLDPQGLNEEGVTGDTTVTIDLSQDISLKSALNLILEPLHLSFVIKDEVLKITSEQLRDRQMYAVNYSVADLVIPIPNFVPNNRMGLQGALADAYNSAPPGVVSNVGIQASALVASRDGTPAKGVINPAVLSQMAGMNPMQSTGPRTGMPQGGNGFGPGGMAGGAQADFDSLIDLITSTISPDTWGDAPGQGSIREFETNLSLVISHTQDVHDQIAELLRQLRKLQDLQVTIEVRFITLNDNFFERIGVDFQFNIQNDSITTQPASGGIQRPTMTVGLLAPGGADAPFPNFTSDLSLPFRQNTFGISTPTFGQPVDVANFGFAILSDLEAYFLIAAAQGDRRSNVLQAPKVTMFNGQQATVSDTTQVPFVISVIPVVGDFAAANQPVIVVLSEGTFLSVQAVVSNDKRFVRLTVVPFFSQIGEVKEFTFSGSTTTTKNTSASDSSTSGGDESTSATNNQTTSSNGVTVQLPSFSFVTVTTTVSVPDGGTVLLGGIKRLSEGRNEFGVPILSKLPYINRLFKNVGIGRETQSLMMMVTPRIIIQEEEEDKLGIAPPPASP